MYVTAPDVTATSTLALVSMRAREFASVPAALYSHQQAELSTFVADLVRPYGLPVRPDVVDGGQSGVINISCLRPLASGLSIPHPWNRDGASISLFCVSLFTKRSLGSNRSVRGHRRRRLGCALE